MQSRTEHIRRQRTGSGFTLVELLLAAAITAMLMTVAAMSFHASFASYNYNQQSASLLSAGRSFMTELVEEIKSGSSHEAVADTLANQITTDDSFAKGITTHTPGIRILKKYPDRWDPNITSPTISNASNGSDTWVTRTYKYDAANKQIIMVRQVGTQEEEAPVVVCQFVDSFTVYMEPTRSQQQIENGKKYCDILFRATIYLKIKSLYGDGLATIRLTDAAMPRKTFSTL